jgi:hypothetical protein
VHVRYAFRAVIRVADKLVGASFEDFLEDVCDRERCLRVEERIRPGYAAIARGEIVDIATGKPVTRKKLR